MIIKKLIPSFFKSKKNEFDKKMMHPVREWLLGLFIFLILIGVGGSVSSYAFFYYGETTVAEINTPEKKVVYKQDMAQKALALYTLRKNKFDTLQNENKVEAAVPLTAEEPVAPTASTTSVVEETVVPTLEAPTTGEVQLSN